MKKLMSFFRDEEGVTAIEYGIIAAMIAIAIIVTVVLVGSQLSVVFSEVVSALK
jgi:pilus assembly protein Flp/PilA